MSLFDGTIITDEYLESRGFQKVTSYSLHSQPIYYTLKVVDGKNRIIASFNYYVANVNASEKNSLHITYRYLYSECFVKKTIFSNVIDALDLEKYIEEYTKIAMEVNAEFEKFLDKLENEPF